MTSGLRSYINRFPPRSPHRSGCHFVFLLITISSLVLSGCSTASAPAALVTLNIQFPSATPSAASTETPPAPATPVPALPAVDQAATPESLSATPTAEHPPYPSATPGGRPVKVSDLLYLSQDNLLRWDPLRGTSLLLAENVEKFAASAGGQAVAYLTKRKITANGLQRFDLEYLNLNSLQAYTILEETPPLLHFALSADGLRLAYLVEVEGGPVYAMSITPEGQASPALRLGACIREAKEDCDALSWSADGRSVVWSDGMGVWVSSVPANLAPAQASMQAPEGQVTNLARLVQPARVKITDPEGQLSEMNVQFKQPTWSPAGRFVLVQVQPKNSTVSWYAVLDTIKELLYTVSETYSQVPGEASARWMENGDLLVVHASDPMQRKAPAVYVIDVFATNRNLLSTQSTYDLHSEALPLADSSRKVIPVIRLNWPGVPHSSWMPIGVWLYGADTAPTLLSLDMQFGRLTRLADLPAGVEDISWSPDGTGGLVIVPGGSPLYFSLEDNRFYNLQLSLQPGAHGFLWLAPTLHP